MDLTGSGSGTDWGALWRRLVEQGSWGSTPQTCDPWAGRADDFDARLTRRWARPHPLRDCVLAQLVPGSTVLDIGAGTGAWAICLAGIASSVTAVDASPAMRKVMRANLDRAGATNVELVAGRWPDLDVAPHDYTICSHAMYGAADLPRFVRRMLEVTRRSCFLLIRSCDLNGITAEASRHVRGDPLHSPDYAVAHNILLQMGLTPDVTVSPEPWDPAVSADLPAALATIKQRLRIGDSTEHDPYLTDLLRRRLRRSGEEYLWPAETRSVLLAWEVADGAACGVSS